MTGANAFDEITVALAGCCALGMPVERVRRCLEPYRAACCEISRHPERVKEHDMRAVARNLRQAATVFILERDCLRGRFAGDI